MELFSRLILKILKNRSNSLLRHSNSNIGKNLKFGDFCTFALYPKMKKFSVRENVVLRNYINILVADNAELLIENQVFMNNFCSVNCLEKIEIGENTLFGEGVKIYDHNHEYTPQKVEHQKFSTAPVKIGKNCWLGSNVTVLKGVTIGDHSIIGAGCTVHKNVEAGSVLVNQQTFKNINS